MNYQKHYDTLISRAKNRLLEGYTENHHIIPRCMNGSNKAKNLVALTPEEHYVAHQLLIKIYPKNHKLVYAALLMTANSSNQFRNNKLYGWLKKKNSESCKGRIPWNKGIPITKERRKNISEARKGQLLSDEHKRKISERQKGKNNHNYGKAPTNERRQKQSNSMKGRNKGKTYEEIFGVKEAVRLREIKKNQKGPMTGKHHTEESKQRISNTTKGKPWSLARRKAYENNKH